MSSLWLPRDGIQPSYAAGFAPRDGLPANPSLLGGLVGAWAPEFGNTGDSLHNVSDRHESGTLINGPTWVVDGGRQSLRSIGGGGGGDNAHVNCGDLSHLFGTEATFFMVLRTATAIPVNTDRTGLCTGAVGGELTLYPYSDENLYLSIFATTRRISAYANGGLDKTQWHSVAITSAPGVGNYKLYQNGQLKTTGTGDATIADNGDWAIGISDPAGAGPRVLGGWWSIHLLFNRALTASEITQLHVDSFAPFRLAPLVISTPSGATAYTLDAATGTYGITGSTAGLLYSPVIAPATGDYAVTGTAASLVYGYVLTAATGSYGITGGDATLTYTTAGAYEIVAEAGSYTITGSTVDLLYGRVLDAAAGSYTHTGVDADLLITRVIAAASGSYVVTGTDATLLRACVLAALAGSYTITGTDVTLTYSGAVWLGEEFTADSYLTKEFTAAAHLTKEFAADSHLW